MFLLFLCRDCYDNKKLKISYPVKPVFSAKPATVNLWNILSGKKSGGNEEVLDNGQVVKIWEVINTLKMLVISLTERFENMTETERVEISRNSHKLSCTRQRQKSTTFKV